MIEWILFQLGKWVLGAILAVVVAVILVFCIADQIGKADNLREWFKCWIKNKLKK